MLMDGGMFFSLATRGCLMLHEGGRRCGSRLKGGRSEG